MNKNNIQVFFNENLRQLDIGTFRQYCDFLKTIFPKSKIKNVVYHHSHKKIEKFKDNFIDGYAARQGISPKAIFFVEKPIKEEFLSERDHIIYSLINIKNPLNYRNKFKTGIKDAKEHSGIKEGIAYAIENQNDGVIFDEIWDNKTWCNVAVIFNSSQIHVLGSIKDIDGFKKFTKNKTKEQI